MKAITRLVIALVVVGVSASAATAQGRTAADVNRAFDEMAKAKWPNALVMAGQEKGAPVAGNTVAASASRELKGATYRRALEILLADQQLMDLFDRVYVEEIKNEEAESIRAESVDARASNPATAGFVERSGATKLIALASDLSQFVGADKTAVTINLNALALIGITDDSVYSSLRQYQSHDALRRISGSVTFGAKIPEKDVTGLSSLPTFDTLFDAAAWDVKVRLIGDRDIRSSKWTDLNIRKGGAATHLAALIPTILPGSEAAEAVIIAQAGNAMLGKELSTILAEVKRSIQVSVKAAGTHLTNETGKDKYSVTALIDAPLGRADLTGNVQYAVTDDVRLGADNLFQIKAWTLSAAITTEFAKGLLADKRSIVWVTSGNANLFQDKESLPIEAKNTFKFTSSVELPIGEAAKVPLSVVFTNDPNNLKDQKHVWSGQVGISYDFAAITDLFKR